MAHPELHLPIESLASKSPPDIALGRDELERIAHLARALHQHAQRAGHVVFSPDVDLRPYPELPEAQRIAMRNAVLRVLQSLVMLGWIDLPT
jgi:hypothetical protein